MGVNNVYLSQPPIVNRRGVKQVLPLAAEPRKKGAIRALGEDAGRRAQRIRLLDSLPFPDISGNRRETAVPGAFAPGFKFLPFVRGHCPQSYREKDVVLFADMVGIFP